MRIVIAARVVEPVEIRDCRHHTAAMTEALLLLVVLGTAALVWQSALRARDRAVRASRELCARAGVQLLDQSVSLRRMALVRLRSGRLALRRHYGFDVSTDGTNRHPGSLQFDGDRLENFSLPLRADDPSVLAEVTRLH